MAPSPANSERNHHVDANPDLARKKQRLSEDHDDSAAEEAVLIEACEPEDIGVGPENAIEIEDDESIMAPYSEDFWVRGQYQPLRQVAILCDEVLSGSYYLPTENFVLLANWIHDHCEKTKDHPTSEWQRQYLEADWEFFSGMGNLALAMLSAGDLFEPADVNKRDMQDAFQKLFVGLGELSCRIIPMLPDKIKTTLSRRDSALHGSARDQPMEFIQYLGVAARSIPKNSELSKSYKRHTTYDTKMIHTVNAQALSHDSVLAALVSIVQMPITAMRQIKNSWIMMKDALFILLSLTATQATSIPNNVIEEVMQAVNASILPAVCEKHPGALPASFHGDLMLLGFRALQKYALTNDHETVCQAYLRFVKSDEDAILPEEAQDSTMSEMLAKVSGDDHEMLAGLLATSWEMQAAMSFIRSDIMNIRSLGLATLGQRLANEFVAASKTAEGFEHTYIQHAVRFLRKNEVTKYIFSSDSHASLVSESLNVISFLSATSTYTDQETDAIWRACSTSVEANFVKAAFQILVRQLQNLDFGHSLHIFRKYATTPIKRLGADATEFLPAILQRLEEFLGPALSQGDRLRLATATIDVLRNVDDSELSAVSGALRSTLHVAVAKFASDAYTTDDRREIFARCLPDIGKHGSAGTTAAEVFTILLTFTLPSEDIQTVLAMYPVSAAVEDLHNYVAAHRGDSQDPLTINCVDLRLSCVLRLMSLEEGTPSDDIAKAIFDCVFGESALSGAARGAAWDKLHAMTGSKSAPSAAIDLWRVYMQRYVPSLPAALASPRLMELIWAYLKDECAGDRFGSDFTHLLAHPLWEALVRFATSSDDAVVDAATSVIAHLLFNYPASQEAGVPRDSAVECQRRSVRAHIHMLCKDYEALAQGTAAGQEQSVLRAINLLHAMLGRSKEFASFYAPVLKHDLLVLDASVEESDRISFTVQVYGAELQPQHILAQASKSTTVSELLAALPPKTGASDNRVIAGGREITSLTTQSLWEAGLQNSGVIQIRPRYTQDFDFDHLLMNIGPVEQEIVAHADSLEVLVDGPAPIAERAIGFLCNLPPTAQARQKVASPSAAEDLFPHDRPARTLFSLYILEWHLRDCARLGVADAGFFARSIQLLTSVLMDESRDWLDFVTGRMVSCLRTFLQGKIAAVRNVTGPSLTGSAERPHSEATPCFADGSSFSARMMAKLFEIELRENVAAKGSIASDAYNTLLLASQMDDKVWEHFSTDDLSAKLHATLLLSPDATLSERIANPIKSLCQDSNTPSKVPDFFWDSIHACLPEALDASSRSAVFFDLACELIHMTNKIREDETNARSVVQQLSAAVWDYGHKESANDLIRDDAIVGLLRLLKDSVIILKSFKKSLNLAGFPSKIAEQLLFPPDKDPGSRPLVHPDTRLLAYDLLRVTLEEPTDFDKVVRATEQGIQSANRQAHATFPGPSAWRRAPGVCSGLTNLGMTCYMNSMLQQLFGNIQFRKFVLDIPVLYPEKQQLLQQIQYLFANMQNNVEPGQNTTELARVLGVQIGNQEDVHDFYANLLSRLEDEMPDRESKVALSGFFTGQSITQIRGECGHVSSQKEAFSDLSVTVKNKATLHDSLAEFVQGEPLEGANKYKCMTCDPQNGRLVDAMRRTCLEEVPDCLTVCLKRFTYENKVFGEGKVNDQFDFPELVDMSQFKRSHLEHAEHPHEPDMFQLAGVIVHYGSLNFGHYWSYVRVPSVGNPGAGEWYYLEDTKTWHCPDGFRTVRQECIGGQKQNDGNERQDNAYVLFYQRKEYTAEASAACEIAGQHRSGSGVNKSLPKVPLDDHLASRVNSHNAWRQAIAALFDNQFSTHVCWLLNQYPNFREAQTGSSETRSSSSSDSTERAQEPLGNDTDAKITALTAHYLLRVLLADPACESKLSQTLTALGSARAANPGLSRHILDIFSVDEFAFEAVFFNGNFKVRTAMFNILTTCIESLRELDQEAYEDALERLLNGHSILLSKGHADKNMNMWEEYFAFPAWVAKQGFLETGMVLRCSYFTWIIEVVYMSQEDPWRQKHQALWNWVHRDNFVDYNPIFHFLYDVLNEHVDLSDFDNAEEDAGPRKRSPQGWCLTQIESKALAMPFKENNRHIWALFRHAYRYSPVVSNFSWKDYGFGKLLGLLVGEKADPRLKGLIANTLIWRYDKEEELLIPLLYATLHYCANTEDSECGELLRSLGNTFHLWPVERRSLKFLGEAYQMAPRSVLNSAAGIDRRNGWACDFVCSAKDNIRQLAETWLKERVFVEEPLSDNPGLDASRARMTRWLVRTLSAVANAAYAKEEPKNRFESAMEVLQLAKTYISTLMKAVAQAEDEGTQLSTEVLVEKDECQALLPQLRNVLETLKDWESEFVLPTRTNIRQSVEIDDTDELVSDEDDLDDGIPSEYQWSQSM